MRLFLIGLFGLCLSGCGSPNGRFTDVRFGDAVGLATTGNLRLITERTRPELGGQQIFCTEPSPDYAIAFGSKAIVSGTGSGNGISVGANGDFESTEQVTAMDGRSAAVLALRDGLYAACQNYANGIIGHDAYALILSQYGDILTKIVAPVAPAASQTTTTTKKAAAADKADQAALVMDAVVAARPHAVVQRSVTQTQSAPTARDRALEAMLVVCLSEFDETRSRGALSNSLQTNGLLDGAFCRSVLRAATGVAGVVPKPKKIRQGRA